MVLQKGLCLENALASKPFSQLWRKKLSSPIEPYQNGRKRTYETPMALPSGWSPTWAVAEHWFQALPEAHPLLYRGRLPAESLDLCQTAQIREGRGFALDLALALVPTNRRQRRTCCDTCGQLRLMATGNWHMWRKGLNLRLRRDLVGAPDLWQNTNVAKVPDRSATGQALPQGVCSATGQAARFVFCRRSGASARSVFCRRSGASARFVF